MCQYSFPEAECDLFNGHGDVRQRVLKDFVAIDVCDNNSGISKDNLQMQLTSEQWDEAMEVNFMSVCNMNRRVIRLMMKARTGSRNIR